MSNIFLLLIVCCISPAALESADQSPAKLAELQLALVAAHREKLKQQETIATLQQACGLLEHAIEEQDQIIAELQSAHTPQEKAVPKAKLTADEIRKSMFRMGDRAIIATLKKYGYLDEAQEMEETRKHPLSRLLRISWPFMLTAGISAAVTSFGPLAPFVAPALVPFLYRGAEEQGLVIPKDEWVQNIMDEWKNFSPSSPREE